VFRELLVRRVSGFCELSTAQLDQLQQHYELMLRWNKTINLTRIERIEEAIDRHYAESLFLGANLPSGPLTIADVGSGAGFPGIPIAILRPDVSMSLIESHQRKAVFLKESARVLPNVTVIAKRAQDVVQEFDWVISRAVSWQDLQGLDLALKWALIGTDAPGDCVALPWANEKHICFVSRETKTVIK
jgi:16S rRNA (guanine(527)-N(7))-methyltransferase RsmG